MENGTGNPKPSWQHSAYTRASAAAEAGYSWNTYEAFATPSNYTHANSHASAPFANSNPPPFTGSTYAAGAAYNNGIALPIASNPYSWAPAAPIGHPNNNAFAPFIDPNPSPFTESTFNASAAYNGGLPFQAAPNPYSLGGGGSSADSNNRPFAPFIDPDPSPFIGASFSAAAAFDSGTTLPTAPNSYNWGPAVAAAHSNDNTFAPLVNPTPSPFNGATFPTGAANSDDGLALPTAPMPYDWEAPAPTGPMDPFMGADFHYPDSSLPTISPFTAANAANANGIGNGFHDQFPTTGYQGHLLTTGLNDHFNTQMGAAVDFPAASLHAAESNVDLAPQRPTCAQCGLSFTRKADLDRHTKSHQAGSKTFKCRAVKGCAYGSHRKDKLGEHVRRRHPGVGVGGVRQG